ncbi:MAG: DNA polymerase elongation subunit [Candidatus Aenigmarchaeota archaeon]|nr:DNA polymerase elongation subunit [Candidatus Aenigmarchaeota archaeon]
MVLLFGVINLYMLLQVLDVDYALVNEKPIIRIFGRTEAGETVCVFYENFMPYFYVMGDNVEDTLKNEGNVLAVEKVKRFMPIGYQTKMTELYRITLKNPARTPELRDRLILKGFKVFEADIPFKYRFMADHDVGGMGWIDVEVLKSVNTNTVKTKLKVHAKNIKNINKDEMCKLKYLAVDIECIPRKGIGIPDSKSDPIIMISLAFSEPYKGKDSIVLATRPDNDVMYFEQEKEMLEKFIDIVTDYDPDIITGYNVNNFDMPYIIDRLQENGIPPLFGRCNKAVMKKQLMGRFKINITGRAIIDTYEIIKRDFSFKRYDLNTVSEGLLNEQKEPVKKSQIAKYWNGTQNEYKMLIKYSIKDAVLALKLLLEKNLLDKYIGLSKVSGLLLQDVLDSGETSRIEFLLLKEFNRQGFILPCKPTQVEVKKREKEKVLEGGFVVEPEKGLHKSVIVLDFKSMYPSLIRTYNICPTTLIVDGGETKHIVSPSGAKFVSENVRKGIIPRILEKLMAERQKVKKQMKTEKNIEKVRELSAKQLALKIMSNAFYGYFGYTRAKVYSVDIANSITSFGRETIKKTKKYIESKFGYKVVYGDTDSVMVKIGKNDIEDIRKIGIEISKDVTNILPGVMELEFEKIFMRFLPLTKKRYAAWSFEWDGEKWVEKIETKGIETVRRDWCDLTSETIEQILNIILRRDDIKAAVEYFKKVANEVAKNKIPIEKLVITKTMTKSADGYAGVQPHAELVKKIKKRNPAEAPGIGDRIGYVIIKGLEMISKRAEDPSYVLEKGLEIDSKYYIENQLLPPLERIFNALGISKNELLGKGKQINLIGAIANGQSNNVNIVDEISSDEFTGFVCLKCHKTYDIPPLSGSCVCGNELLFSSPKGPAKKIKFA